MSRLVNIALDEDAFVAEAASGLVLGRAEAVAHLRRTMRNTHTLAAAPSRGFDHHREADLFRNAYSFLGRGDFADVARHGADLRFRRQPLGLDLVAHGRDGRSGRADEDQTCLLDRFHKGGPFGKEAKARMDRLGFGLLRSSDDSISEEIAF